MRRSYNRGKKGWEIMTKAEAREILDNLDFQPAIIRMNNGDEFFVPHRDFVVVTTRSTMHVYEASDDDARFPDFKFKVIALHNVSSIEPAKRRAAS